MRLVFACLLMALVCVLSVALWSGGASALMPVAAPSARQPLVHDAKIVCGDFGNGYTCRRESGAVRRSGKARQVPGSSSDSSGSSGGWFGGRLFGGGDDKDPDALPPPSEDAGTVPPASGSAGTAPPQPSARAAACPENSELLGGHCIPYTQRCTNGIPPTAYPPQCRGEEKQVCNFHPDGSKDCCCRTYSKF
jgi:hypothetical protein